MYVKNLTNQIVNLNYKGILLAVLPDNKYHIVPYDVMTSNLFKVVRPSKQQIATFCMSLRGRSKLALEAIENIVNKYTAKYFDFIIIESKSEDPLIIPEKYKPFITHYYVDSGKIWNRSKLLNYGFKRATTPLVSGWDCDFRFPTKFYSKFFQLISSYDFTQGYISIVTTETNDCIRLGKQIKKGDPYGGFHTFFRQHVDILNGFNEKYNGFGWEEISLLCRINRYVDPDNWKKYFNKSYNEYREKDLIWHKSHGDNLRTKENFKRLNTNKEKLIKEYQNNVTILEKQKNWGNTSKLIAINGIQYI